MLITITFIVVLALSCVNVSLLCHNEIEREKPNEEDILVEVVGENCLKLDRIEYSRDWDCEEDYLLAKIAMAEAEDRNLECKICVIMTILNRVHNENFPDSIRDVIFEHKGNVYQFTPIIDGRWNSVEPNEECYKALAIVKKTEYDVSRGSLFFECCNNPDNWHSRNLEKLFESDGVRFYK